MGTQTWVGKTALVIGAMLSIAHAVQPMRFERLGLDEGLSQLAANAIAQDAQGFLWVGTEEGLDRYDGYGFQHFRHDRANPRSLANDFISADLGAGVVGSVGIGTVPPTNKLRINNIQNAGLRTAFFFGHGSEARRSWQQNTTTID